MRTLLKGGTILDCETDYKKKDVLICGETIEQVEDRIPEQSADRVVELCGMTIMPCFIDCHVHINSRIGPSDKLLKGFAQNGISAVNDMGLLNDSPLKPYISWLRERDTPEYARVTTAGRYIDVADGYGMGPGKGAPWGIEIKTARDAEAAVAGQAALGVNGVKTGLSDGFVGPIRKKISSELLRALAESARSHELWFSVHIGRVDDLRLAVECGMTAAAHTPGDREIDDACIELMVRNGVSMTTTVGDFMNSVRFVPMGYYNATDLRAHQGMMLMNLKKFYDAGGIIGVGTDRSDRDGSGGNPVIPVWELAQLLSIGLPKADVIRAGTVNAARICGIEDEGLVRSGMRANLLAFHGELSDSFEQLLSPPFVVNRGKVLMNRVNSAVIEPAV